ncbi:MAG: glycosyltransferase family 2 protein [Candidatus Eisenbacteria bacterium]|uniref:Glycosyltransferase family 2 protein n=1 Tax=Eiseniibacteriota bacterium TaxID=2212470 RepID=A0A538SV92_UNCEI|nr:MAG: glycosyltransferase family 2 protein [Candidatus Eisenbacteria bacterium]
MMGTGPVPRASIGLPVYNGEQYLAEALDSLLAQTFEDFELIVCDNASTDRTEEIGRRYAAQDRRVRYERNARNLGAPANYRRAFELSRGRYFRWAAADDVSAPQSLARCLEVLEREPNVVLAYPKTRFIDERSRVTADYEDRLHVQSSKASDRFYQVLRRLERCNAIYGLMRADVLKCTRLLGDFLAADVVFMTELSLYGTFWEVPEFLFYRRFHAAASSAMDQTQIRTFYDPANPRRIRMREWRHLWELSRAVGRAPLAVAEKVRLWSLLAWRTMRVSDRLAGELLGATRCWLTSALR